jgi:hypothetical protein
MGYTRFAELDTARTPPVVTRAEPGDFDDLELSLSSYVGRFSIERLHVLDREEAVETFRVRIGKTRSLVPISSTDRPVNLSERRTCGEALLVSTRAVLVDIDPQDCAAITNVLRSEVPQLQILRSSSPETLQVGHRGITTLLCSPKAFGSLPKGIAKKRMSLSIVVLSTGLDAPAVSRCFLDPVDDLLTPDWPHAIHASIATAKRARKKWNLNAAWELTSWDTEHRHFVRLPNQELVYDRWRPDVISKLTRQLLTRGFKPCPSDRIQVPKSRLSVRIASRLQLPDAVAYSAMAQRIAQLLGSQIRQPSECSYQLLPRPAEGGALFRHPYKCWRTFERRSRALLKGASYVLCADISAFYDNIDLDRIIVELHDCGIPSSITKALDRGLHSWAGTREKGIPQGHSASDLLAKFYLSPVDSQLLERGVRYVRYVDDFRIFCTSERAANETLKHLYSLLEQRGLSIQSAKTRILTAPEATKEFAGDTGQIDELDKFLREQLAAGAGVPPPYAMAIDDFNFLPLEQARASKERLEETFRSHIAHNPNLDPSLLHFLLRRLAKVGSSAAIDFSARALREYPEHTGACLEYLERIHFPSSAVASVVRFLGSQECHFEYQQYLILRWLSLAPRLEEIQAALDVCRNIVAIHQAPVWLFGYAVQLLSRYGPAPDLGERNLGSYSAIDRDIVTTGAEDPAPSWQFLTRKRA